MEFRVSCECGKSHTVTAAAAGAKLACQCGRSVAVPSLSELRRQGLAAEIHPVLAIQGMIDAGELPPRGGCVRCGAESEVVSVTAECERKHILRRGGFSWATLILTGLFLP